MPTPEPSPGGGRSALEIADLAAGAARATPGVAEVTAGPGGYGATYGLGRRVEGVRVRRQDPGLAVHVSVALHYPSPVSAIANQVHDRVVASLRDHPDGAGPLTVTVRVVDVVPADGDWSVPAGEVGAP